MVSRWKMIVSEHLDKGSRGYMEDFICNHVEKVNGKLLFGIFGVFDGHGGSDAANFVKKSLVEELKRNIKFWSNNDNSVLMAIKEVYHRIQNLMWVEREKWPQTIAGYKSTAGTTATIAIVRNNKLYVGHVGDSAMVLANHNDLYCLKSEQITQEHKPNDIEEKSRIEKCGGSLKKKAGIVRIVWNRKKILKNEIEQVPFLAVARSLGDLWSYDLSSNSYHVSPEPDVFTIELSAEKHRAIILASDGVWNVVDGETSVNILTVCNNLDKTSGSSSSFINPAQLLVNYSLYQWKKKRLRPDNICAVIVQLIPENSSEALDNGINCHVADLQTEILNNGLVSRNGQRSVNILDSIDNFVEYSPINDCPIINNQQEDTELLKMFVLSSETLARHCLAWRNDMTYWNKLKISFTNLGITRFPNLIAHFDYSVSLLEDLLVSFSWSLMCLRCIDESPLYSKNDVDKLHTLPLLSDFWVSFYRRIVSPNLCFTTDQLTDPSIYHMIMNHILTHRTADIQRFIDGVSHSPTLPYTLKKSQSYSNHHNNNTDLTLSTVFTCFKLTRSASLDLATINTSSTNASVLPIIADSNSSTPLMSPSHSDTVIDTRKSLNLRFVNKRRSDIFLSSKKNLSRKLSRLPLASFKKKSAISKRRFIKYFARKKLRTQ